MSVIIEEPFSPGNPGSYLNSIINGKQLSLVVKLGLANEQSATK